MNTAVLSQPLDAEATEVRHCNLCGRVLDAWDIWQDFSIHRQTIGYGSRHDGSALHIRFCCRCMDKIIRKCLISPVVRDS